MNRSGVVVLTLAITAALSGCATSGGAPAGAAASVDPALAPVAWLEGAWSRTDERGMRTEEYWTPPRAGTMFAVNRVIAGDKTVFYENLRIEVGDDGTLVYLASPKGRMPPTPFRLITAGDHEVVFENPEHDFPQRISYRLQADGELRMRIEGVEGGETKRGEWRMQRESP